MEAEMAKYTTILWDLDQTLLNFDLSMEHALQAAQRMFYLKYGVFTFLNQNLLTLLMWVEDLM